MAVIKKQNFEKMSEGLHNVVITDVKDIGQKETMYGVKDQLRIVFTAQDQKDKEGKPVDATMTVNKVISAKSSLGILLDKLGIDGSGDEFDTDIMIGTKCQVVIEHKENDGRVYANITSVLKKRKSEEV